MLTITPATSNDTQTVLAILLDATRWLQSRSLPTWSPNALLPVMAAAIERNEVYLAYLDAQPAGTISIQWTDETYWGERSDDAGYIHKLATLRAVAGQHIGAQMLSWAEDLIEHGGRPYARLDCHATNPAINHFYVMAGYEPRGSLVVPELTGGVMLNLYEKRLLKPLPGC